MKASLIGVTALSMLPGVLGLGNIVFFYSNNCSGTAVGCWNIGVGTCCTGGGTAFASGKAENGDIYLDAWSHTGCTGTRIGGQTAGNCLQPSFAIMSGMTFTVDHDNDRKRNLDLTPPSKENCMQPNVAIYKDESGKEVVVKIPEGRFAEFEEAAKSNDISKLQKLERVQ